MDTKTNHNLPSFKYLLINSFGFIKSNWKDLLVFFVPLQILILLIALLFDFDVFAHESIALSVLGVVAFVILLAITIFRKLAVFGGGLVVSEIEKKETHTLIQWYKIFWQKIIPVAHVGALSLLVTITFVLITIILGVIIFALPFILLGLVARVYPYILELISWQSQMITLFAFFVVFFVIVLANLLFFVSMWFASYSLLLEKKKGLDAIASSFMYVFNRRGQIIWRILVIGIISFVPALVFLGPIYYKIIANALGQMLFVYAIGLNPVFPEIPLSLVVWRDVLGALVGLIWMPIFVVLNYFLWKDVKATAVQFNEALYTKTRKWLKIASWTGLVVVVVITCVFFTGVQFVNKNDTGNIAPSGFPLINNVQ